MNIVVISKTPNLLVFSPNKVKRNAVGLKIDFTKSKKASEPRILEINNEEDFQQACTIVRTRSRQVQTTINGWLNSGDYNENQVFIVPEGWDDSGSIDKGYEMARELLNCVGKIKPFNLRFVSRYPCEQLLTEVKKENKALVETIPHLYLFDHQVTITPEAYSTAHFRLIRDIVISDSGRLSLIRHEVKNIVEEKLDDEHLKEAIKRFQQHALKILDDLDCSTYIKAYDNCQQVLQVLQGKVNNIAAVISADDFKNASTKLQNEIIQLIYEITIRLPHADPQETQLYEKKNYRVLIIEDNRDQRNSLYHFFNSHYAFVTCNDIKATLDKKEYEQWERQLEATYCHSIIEQRTKVEGFLNTIQEVLADEEKKDNKKGKKKKILKYDELKKWDYQLQEILQDANRKVEKHKNRFSKCVESLQGITKISKSQQQALVVALKNILTELDIVFANEKKQNVQTLKSITLDDYGLAMNWINNMKEIGSMFDIVILDLLLKDKDEKTLLPFSGIDLLCSIRKDIPFNTVRIITSLPRHEVGSILKEENVVVPMNQIFTKGNGWPQLEGCLYDRLDEINIECKENETKRRKIQKICMPNRGEFFNHSEVREYAQRLIKEGKFQKVFAQAQKLIGSQNTVGNSIQLMGKHGFNKSQIANYFVNYLAHRLAFLDWAANNSSTILAKGINFTEYSQVAPSYHIIRDGLNKAYFNSIGFKISDEIYVILEAQTLFQQELDFYFKGLMKHLGVKGISESMLTWCVCVIRPLMSDNKKIREHHQFVSFCSAIDNNNLSMDDILKWLRECIRCAKSDYHYRNALAEICQQEWFTEMDDVIKELKDAEKGTNQQPSVGAALENYLKH